MNSNRFLARWTFVWLAIFGGLYMAAVGFDPFLPDRAVAQEAAPADSGEGQGEMTPEEAAAMADAAIAAENPEEEAEEEEEEKGVADDTPEMPNILELLISGGYLMLPIAFMSLLVVTFGVERLLGLRRHKVLPPELIEGLGKTASQPGGLKPRDAYKLCQQYPSAASNVIKSMLLKIGRPHSELEHAVAEANEREASRLYTNVRWLSLAASVTPLMGLLGTVWGMIQAFFVTANLPTGANKSVHLSQGIYVALVTTFAGLCVAIPAAVLAHVFEGRLQKLFRELDETLLGMMPQLERFEGRMRPGAEPTSQPNPQPTAQTAPQAKPRPKPAPPQE